MRRFIVAIAACLSLSACDHGTLSVSGGSRQDDSQSQSSGMSWIQRLVEGRRREATVETPAYTTISQAVRHLAYALPAAPPHHQIDVFAPTLMVDQAPSSLSHLVQLLVPAAGNPDAAAAKKVVAAAKEQFGFSAALAYAVSLAHFATAVPATKLQTWYQGYGVAHASSPAAYTATELAVGDALYAIQPTMGWPSVGASDANVSFARVKARSIYFADALFGELYRRTKASDLHDPIAAQRAIEHALVRMTPQELDKIWHSSRVALREAEGAHPGITVNGSGVPGAQWAVGSASFALLPSGPELTVAGADYFGGAGGAIEGSRRVFRVASLLGAEQSEGHELSQGEQQSLGESTDAKAGVK